MLTIPASGASSAYNRRSSVVLPLPLGPTSPSTAPSSATSPTCRNTNSAP
jgi:hypothetical protein